jgi:hypothetical protein
MEARITYPPLATALNTVRYYSLWSDCNGTNRFYAAAARVGHDPTMLLSKMDGMIGAGKSNYTLQYGCGGTENFNTVPAAVSEMSLQSARNRAVGCVEHPVHSALAAVSPPTGGPH